MPNFVHKTLTKAISLIEENFANKCIYLSFPQYVSLVQYTIDNYLTQHKWKKNRKPIIFTALCITPLQWFNFRITPLNHKKAVEIANIEDIDEMYADKHWIDYHHFLIRHTCSKLQFHSNRIECSAKKDITHCHKGILHRMLFPVERRGYCHDEIQDQTNFDFFRYLFTINFPPREKIHFPNEIVVRNQLLKFSIGVLNDGFLFKQSDLAAYTMPYTISRDKAAYLIADERLKQHILSLNKDWQFFPLADFLKNLYQNPLNVKLNYSLTLDQYNLIARNRLPEDFIIFGYTENGNRSWEFAIASDVANEKEFSKVTLQFGDDNATFNNLCRLVNGILNEHPTS